MKINYLQEIEENKKFHHWYGGDVVEIIYNDEIKFVISAIGDIIGRIYENGELVSCFKDKHNNGSFHDTAFEYINNDDELELAANYDYIDEEYLKENKDKEYIINFISSNWWEVFPVINGEYLDIMHCLDSYSLDDAIDEVINNIDILLNYIYEIAK